jgi:hypothetical protein
MPLSTARFSLQGRSRPSAWRTGSGKKRPIRFHCSSVRSREWGRSSEGHPFRMASVPGVIEPTEVWRQFATWLIR